jgi:hypothetical protein
MRKIFEIILLMFVAIKGYSQSPHRSTEDFQNQCDSNKIIFVDSLGKEISSNQTKLVYNGIDIIYLDQLNDLDLKYFIGYGESNPIDSTGKFCAMCREEAIKIVDSIDINNDGVKELFLLRQWYCSETPANVGPYGEGGQRLGCSKYEVWDVKSKKKIFEIKNWLYIQRTVSTSVVTGGNCEIDVSINEFGSFILSNLSGDNFGDMHELGTYKYDIETNAYKKE